MCVMPCHSCWTFSPNTVCGNAAFDMGIEFNDACDMVVVYNVGTCQPVVFVCKHACYPN